MDKLSEDQMTSLRQEIQAHNSCGHRDATHCTALILMGAGLVHNELVEQSELREAAERFVVDETISSLILKGLVEVKGMTEDGDMMYGLAQVPDQTDRKNEARSDLQEAMEAVYKVFIDAGAEEYEAKLRTFCQSLLGLTQYLLNSMTSTGDMQLSWLVDGLHDGIAWALDLKLEE